MIKPIYIKDENGEVKYTLEFNREAIRFAESRGFNIQDVEKYPLTKVYELFYYAFRMHHKKMSKAETDALLDSFGGVANLQDGFLEKLGELYIAPFSTLEDEDAPKNAGLTMEL